LGRVCSIVEVTPEKREFELPRITSGSGMGLVTLGGIVVPGLETESDRAYEEEIASEEFEVALHGLGNVVVVVLTEGGFPQKGSSQETGKDVNHDESRGEKSGCGM